MMSALMHTRLARAGGTGDQQVRHRGEVGGDLLAGHVLADGEHERARVGHRVRCASTSPRVTVVRPAFGTSMPT